MASALHEHLVNLLRGVPRIDRVSVRAKDVERFLGKSARTDDQGSRKYSDPLVQIQDQIGARVVVFYLSDVNVVAAELQRYLRPIEDRFIVPDSESEFGYFGKHYVFLVPTDVRDPSWGPDPRFFELQIKTLFQHAWSEAEHDLGYKPSGALTPDQRRRIAFTAAQAWGADTMFDELFRSAGA